MKRSSIFSALIGGAFFAIPYIALDVAFFPSTLIAVAAFGAGNLLFSDNSSVEDITKQSITKKRLFPEVIAEARKQNAQIYAMMNKVQDKELIKDIKDIHETVGKIIDAISKKPEKQKYADNFFSYYLPSTLSFLRKYDEIENQELNSKESIEFMNNAEEMMKKISESFKVQLAELYKTDMIGTGAEMKVFDTMLKTDGIDVNSDFDIK